MTDLAGALPGVRVLFPKGLNVSIYLSINRFARRTAWAHGFMHDYALWLGLVLVTLAVLGVYATLWWHRQVRAAALLVLGGAGTLAALGLNQLVGHAARELRPYDTLPPVLVLVGRANDYAFPTDHAVVAGGLVTAILLVLWRGQSRRTVAALAATAAIFALLLCFARIYVGAHYPGDVVAGFLLGGTVVVAVALALRAAAEAIAGLLLRTPLAVLVQRPWPHGGPASGSGEHQLPDGRSLG